MNLLARGLDQREARLAAQDEADDTWLRERAGVDPEQRRAAWRRWLFRHLETSLQWPKNEAAKARLIGQCAAELTTVARQLRGRGWLLDGQALAAHVKALLAPVAEAQRAGKIDDFWPYFRASVRRYVGAHAEEIQAQARRTGADEAAQTMASALAAFGLGAAAKNPTTLTEILATRTGGKADSNAPETGQQKLL